MTLLDFSLISVSIASILFSVVLIMVLASSGIIYKRINSILDQLEVMAHTGLETSRTVHDYVEKTGETVTAFIRNFITIRGATELIGHIGEAIKEARSQKHHEEATYEPKSE